MRVISTGTAKAPAHLPGGPSIDEGFLRRTVEAVAVPRHYLFESAANRRVRDYIFQAFAALSLRPSLQGASDNVVATLGAPLSRCRVLVGAHYDSVPDSPGADDNGSALAALLALAGALRPLAPLPVALVAFNREEDGMVGSGELVELLKGGGNELICAHVLEMVGYCSHAPGSQSLPAGLPIRIADTGDFIGIISNQRSNGLVRPIVEIAERQQPDLPVKGLQVFAGMERLFPHLLRSDHAPFWRAGLPALMWTDTAEFRNPNYHGPGDLPETLDYAFLRRVCMLLTRVVLTQLRWCPPAAAG